MSDAPLDHESKESSPLFQEGFAFVMNLRSLDNASSYVLAPGHELKRATSTQVAEIKKTLLATSPNALSAPFYLWEQELPASPGARVFSNDESTWRYFVINFSGTNQVIGDLQVVFDLSSLELEIGFTMVRMGQGYGFIWTPARTFHVLESANRNDPFLVELAPQDIGTVRAIYEQYVRFDHQLVDVKRLAMQLGDMKALPHYSPLRFLGYFAILESLLTHPPKPSDPYDSITRQVKKKLALLNNRWSRKLDYGPFGNASPDSIWTHMYEYRSRLAHGGNADMTGKLTLLKNHETALALLKTAVKAIIRQALSEPQLLLDLKEC